MTAYTALVTNLINERIDVLNSLIDKTQETGHKYALMAGLFELLSLGEKVQGLAQLENDEIEKRISRDIEIGWTLNPDRSGGAFTQEEIDRSRGDW